MPTEIRCCFDKALISGSAECVNAERLEIGERLLYQCRSPLAAQRCNRYLDKLRQNARFVFRQTGDSILSNYQEICLQCGGLQGLAAISREESSAGTLEISSMLQNIETEFQGIENIPLDKVVPRIAAYNPRPHRKKK